jgi:hypothetical protein
VWNEALSWTTPKEEQRRRRGDVVGREVKGTSLNRVGMGDVDARSATLARTYPDHLNGQQSSSAATCLEVTSTGLTLVLVKCNRATAKG